MEKVYGHYLNDRGDKLVWKLNVKYGEVTKIAYYVLVEQMVIKE